MESSDPRFSAAMFDEAEAGPSKPRSVSPSHASDQNNALGSEEHDSEENSEDEEDENDELEGHQVVEPLSAEALAAFEAAEARKGIVYISRIPPAMRPSKVRHLMSAYGEVGRVYLQQEDPKRAHLRRKHTSTKKAHYTEGWVEFLDKKVGRAVAEMLNGQSIGGKKGTRFRDDVWTMKYLPRFKWNMLTEQVSHEAAAHTARLRVELSQSRTEQRDYLKNVELARVLAKREEKKRKREVEEGEGEPQPQKKNPQPQTEGKVSTTKKRRAKAPATGTQDKDLGDVLSGIF